VKFLYHEPHTSGDTEDLFIFVERKPASLKANNSVGDKWNPPLFDFSVD
jgi:hypothetical protein